MFPDIFTAVLASINNNVCCRIHLNGITAVTTSDDVSPAVYFCCRCFARSQFVDLWCGAVCGVLTVIGT